MKMEASIPEMMLAPCGMNCYVCYAHLRQKKACMGCRGEDACKPNHCRVCAIKTCANDHHVTFCADCDAFPCQIIKRLDKSYRDRYQISLIANANRMKEIGIEAYLAEERAKWTCSHCGGVISLHDAFCSECGEKI